MDAQARAGVELHDSVLRYAEVERYGSRARLLRLGTCDFDFHLVDDVLRGGDSSALTVVREALEDVFSGTIASAINISLHPHLATSFFTSVPASTGEDERQRRLANEAALLTGVTTAADLNLSVTGLGSPGTANGERYSVVTIPIAMRRQLDTLLESMPQSSYGFHLTTQDAASIVMRRWQAEAAVADAPWPLSLAVGLYQGRVEFSAINRGSWLYSHNAQAETAVDAAFFGVALLDQLGQAPESVGQILLYGDRVPTDAVPVFESIWSAEVRRLNPLELVDLDPDTLTGQFASEAYVPCIGAAF